MSRKDVGMPKIMRIVTNDMASLPQSCIIFTVRQAHVPFVHEVWNVTIMFVWNDYMVIYVEHVESLSILVSLIDLNRVTGSTLEMSIKAYID